MMTALAAVENDLFGTGWKATRGKNPRINVFRGSLGLTSAPVHSVQTPLWRPTSQGALSSLCCKVTLSCHSRPHRRLCVCLPHGYSNFSERSREKTTLPSHMEHRHHLWLVCYRGQELYEERNMVEKTRNIQNIFPLTNQMGWLYYPKIYTSKTKDKILSTEYGKLQVHSKTLGMEEHKSM